MGNRQHGKYKKRSKSVITNRYGTIQKRKGRPKKTVQATCTQPNASHATSSGTEKTSASKRKLHNIRPNSCPSKDFSAASGYRFMDMDIISNILNKYATCPLCSCELTLMENSKLRRGFASVLHLKCENCYFSDTFSISQKILGEGKGDKPFEVNRRATMAFREIGKGHGAMTRFCAVMDMPSPPGKASLTKHNKALQDAYKDEAELSMNKAAQAVRDKFGGECGVSVDGTWQRRGYSSINGVVTAIELETGKILDYECLTRICKGCQHWSSKDQTSTEYLKWKADHKCHISHEGSAASMEPVGAKRIWNRSVANRNLKYTSKYIGDGDTKSYSAVCNDKPYGHIPVIKKECRIATITHDALLEVRVGADSIGTKLMAPTHTSILMAVVKELKPIYDDLTKDELIERCVDCYTQNANESFNGMIWQRIPKETHAGAMTLDIGVASATLAFNDGMQALLGVLQRQNMNPGTHTTENLKKLDEIRIQNAERQTSDKSIKRRKTLRRIKKGYEDKHLENEGVIYDPGMGD
ncbi:uncharacterized protein [Amphiura filiformis]|uniref:uncharacterized protein n=1 Tax=Amphiura filiformis TaxID=82378 RepID=UPI003B2210A7